MEVLLGKTLEELQAVAQEVGLPRFAGKQLAEWIYVRRATSFDEMTNISLKGREALKARYTILTTQTMGISPFRHSPRRVQQRYSPLILDC